MLRRSTPVLLLVLALALASVSLAPTAGASPVVVYSTDFTGGADAAWSGFVGISATPNDLCADCGLFLGHFGAGTSTLSLASLPSHDTVTVSFDLFLLISWDGNAEHCLSCGYGPDAWRLAADGTTVFQETFANVPDAVVTQSYPVDGSPARSGAASTNTLGYGGSFGDSVYHLTVAFPHTASTLALDFTSLQTQAVGDESWGIDDVSVTLSTEAVVEEPEPPVCASGHGFWKNHPEAWPESVTGLTLGGHEYTNEELLTILKTPVGSGKKADATIILAYQLIATNLSAAAGADASVVQSEVDNATELLQAVGRIPADVRPNTAAGTAMVENASTLDAFVNGLLTEGCHTDVAMDKAGPTAATLGDAVVFTLNASNAAWVPAKGVVVTDTLPAGLTYVSDDAGCSASGQVVTCALGEIAPQGWMEIHITASATACGTLTNTATVTSTSEPADHQSDNTDSADVTVSGCA